MTACPARGLREKIFSLFSEWLAAFLTLPGVNRVFTPIATTVDHQRLRKTEVALGDPAAEGPAADPIAGHELGRGEVVVRSHGNLVAFEVAHSSHVAHAVTGETTLGFASRIVTVVVRIKCDPFGVVDFGAPFPQGRTRRGFIFSEHILKPLFQSEERHPIAT